MNARLFLHQRTVEMEKINYEKSVARLEEIVDKLENGNLSLEEIFIKLTASHNPIVSEEEESDDSDI